MVEVLRNGGPHPCVPVKILYFYVNAIDTQRFQYGSFEKQLFFTLKGIQIFTILTIKKTH